MLNDNNDEAWFVISDIEEFTDKVRIIVYNNFGTWDNDKTPIDMIIDSIADSDRSELDKLLSHQEALNIISVLVKKQKHKITKEIRYLLSDAIFIEIVSNLNDRMISNVINSLTNKGILESAFDSKKNDFVFWIKDDSEDQPETD